MKSNLEQLKIAQKYLGEKCRVCCNMANNCCCYYVCKVFKEAGNAKLFYDGYTVTYCPNARKWCKANLAQIPLYLAMPMDVIFFDWQPNGTPDHIGFVHERVSDQEINTIEGNTTSKYVVAYRTRPLYGTVNGKKVQYIQGIFRPHYPATYKVGQLKVDGQFDYSSIAMLQKALGIKVNGILSRDTVKALQKKVGADQDGSWGDNTSKAVQKFLKKEGFYKGEVDGCIYIESVKALQRWINSKIGKTTTTTDKTATVKPQTPSQPSVDDGKLTIDGSIGRQTVLRMQEFFETMKDGVISGQKESLYKYYPSVEKSVIKFCDGGSQLVAKMQKWCGIAEDGIWGEDTSKAVQKKLGVTADGIFGTNSAKALQKYLNENDKAVYPKNTRALKLVAEFRKFAWACGTASKTWDYDTGYARDEYKDALKKYMGVTSKVSQSDCGYFLNVCVRDSGLADDFKMLGTTKANFPTVPSPFYVALEGKAVPDGFLKPGDMVRYKKKSGSQHTYGVVDSTHIAEAGRKIRFPIIREVKEANDKCNASTTKLGTLQVIRVKEEE